jgi:hypothetical protein
LLYHAKISLCNTPNGATSSAMIYSIIETSKANNLKPFEYMTYLLEVLPNVNVKDQNVLDFLMPWSSGRLNLADFTIKLYNKRSSSCRQGVFYVYFVIILGFKLFSPHSMSTFLNAELVLSSDNTFWHPCFSKVLAILFKYS